MKDKEVDIKEPPKTKLFDHLIELVTGYSEVSSLHGVAYIADNSRHFIERCSSIKKDLIKFFSYHITIALGSFGLSL